MEEVNIAKLLKGAPKGTDLYSKAYGNVKLKRVYFNNVEGNVDVVIMSGNDPTSEILSYHQNGALAFSNNNALDLLPCKDGTWENFKAPWKRKTFEPYQKVLVKTVGGKWEPYFYAYGFKTEHGYYHRLIGGCECPNRDIIPYSGNEDKLGKEV